MKHPTLDLCDECGHVHVNARYGKPSCVAHRKHIRPKVPCTRLPANGSNVCDRHGFRAPQVKAKAKQRVIQRAVRAELDSLGVPPEVDLAEGMLYQFFAGHRDVQMLERWIAGLPEQWTQTDILPAGGARVVESIHRVMLHQARERVVHWGKVCRDAKVEERQVEIRAEQADQLVVYLQAAGQALFAAVEPLIAEEHRRRFLEIQLIEAPRLITGAIEAQLSGGAGGEAA